MAKGKGKAKAKAPAIAKSPPRSAKARGKEKMPVPKAKPIHFSALPTPVRVHNVWNAVCNRCCRTRLPTAFAM